MTEATSHFIEAFASGVGSPHIHCICGRQHYAPDSEYVSDRERDEMQEHAREEPSKVVIHDREDGVSAAVVNGSTVVRDCPCGWFAKFEALVWAERERILVYYRMRRDADLQALQQLDASMLKASP